jgi:hypothetical protein
MGTVSATDRNRPDSDPSSGTAHSRFGLSPPLAGFLQTDIPAIDDGRWVMIPEMLRNLTDQRTASIARMAAIFRSRL